MLRYVLEAGAAPAAITKIDDCAVVLEGEEISCQFGVGGHRHTVKFEAHRMTRWLALLLKPVGGIVRQSANHETTTNRVNSFVRRYSIDPNNIFIVSDALDGALGFPAITLRELLQNVSRRLDIGIAVDVSGTLHVVERFHSGIRQELEGSKYSFEGPIRRKINLD
ncbi:hypothetical protein EVC24_044 [Rhizobium phage RHph_I4]|nr:hypothetical protein EVC24_044 [Rhizobium phage RHph_I4]